MTSPFVPRDAVVAACAISGHTTNGIAYNDDIWIKYGDSVTEAEAILQQHVYEHADPSIFRTPKVYDFFTISSKDNISITYIVIEHVHGTALTTSEPDDVLDRVAAAVRHLWELPLPPLAAIGPLADQIPFDWFFSDYGAGRTFQSVGELQNWINEKLKDNGYPDRITLSLDCYICHGDLSQFNILRDPIIILDWGRAGIYPRIFDEYALFRQFNLRGAKFAKALHGRLFKKDEYSHLRPLAIAANINAFGS
jgi:hypothetical protein